MENGALNKVMELFKLLIYSLLIHTYKGSNRRMHFQNTPPEHLSLLSHLLPLRPIGIAKKTDAYQPERQYASVFMSISIQCFILPAPLCLPYFLLSGGCTWPRNKRGVSRSGRDIRRRGSPLPSPAVQPVDGRYSCTPCRRGYPDS